MERIKWIFVEKDAHILRVILINTIVIYIFLIPEYEKSDTLKNIFNFIIIYLVYMVYFIAVDVFADCFVKDKNKQ